MLEVLFSPKAFTFVKKVKIEELSDNLKMQQKNKFDWSVCVDNAFIIVHFITQPLSLVACFGFVLALFFCVGWGGCYPLVFG